jgi:hypothetical protein
MASSGVLRHYSSTGDPNVGAGFVTLGRHMTASSGIRLPSQTSGLRPCGHITCASQIDQFREIRGDYMVSQLARALRLPI